jgi:hypothetical protein
MQSTPSHFTSLKSILILTSHLHLVLQSRLLRSRFTTIISYEFLISPTRATYLAHLLANFFAHNILPAAEILFGTSLQARIFCQCQSLMFLSFCILRVVYQRLLLTISVSFSTFVSILEVAEGQTFHSIFNLLNLHKAYLCSPLFPLSIYRV